MINMLVKRDYKFNLFKEICQYFFMFLIVLNCGSVFSMQLGTQSIVGKIIKLIFQSMLLIFTIYALTKRNTKISQNFIGFIFIYLLYFLIIIFVEYLSYSRLPSSDVIISFVDLLMFIICFKNSLLDDSFFIKFENIIIFIAIISLFFWAVASLGVSPNTSINIGWGSTASMGGVHNVPSYYYLYFVPQNATHLLFLKSIFRNSGIFVEAPMYSYVLCLALFTELFIKKRSKLFNYKIFILLITIFTTTSSLGIIISIVAIACKYILLINNNYKYVVIIILFIIILLLIKTLILNKINEGLSSNFVNYNSSYFVRMDDITACIRAWINHIFIGNGYNINIIYKYMNNQRFLFTGDTGLSTGFFTMLSNGGLFLAIFYILPTILSLMYKKIFLIAILCFILSMFNMVSYTYIYIMILAYLWYCISSNTSSNLDNI